MLLGKPVIATGYSGNVDFMTPQNSYLVDYTRVALTEDIDPYPRGAVWAEPDVVHAAIQMRRVYDRREESLSKRTPGGITPFTSNSSATAGSSRSITNGR